MVQEFKINQDNCIGCGACIAITSDYGFIDFDDSGKAYAKKQPQTEEELNSLKEAKSACPVNGDLWPIIIS